MAAFGVGTVEPKDAVAAFTRRGQLLPSFAWQDVFQEEHGTGLAVAGVSRLDVLKVFQDELELTAREGRSLIDFQRRIQPRLVAAGFWGDVEVEDADTGDRRITRFDKARLQLIMDVNLRQSHAAGRWERSQRTKRRMPYLVYLTMADERVRQSHRRWHALVLPVDHPFWDTHYPPNGWRCRCYARPIDDAGVERLRAAGIEVHTEAPDIDLVPYVNPRTGEVTPVPRGIDPGFAYNPGKRRDAAAYDAALRKAVAAHPLAAATAVAQATASRAAFVADATAAFDEWVVQVLAAGQARGELRFIGALRPPAVRALNTHGVEPATAAIAVRDIDVLHALRDSKRAAGVAVDASVYKRLPELLERASAVLLERDSEPPALLYVVDLVAADGSVAKLVVQVDVPVKATVDGVRQRRVPLNLVRTATVLGPGALQDSKRYRVLWGRL